MAYFKQPLSGDVLQWINPMTWFMSGNSVNVYLGQSSAPQVEADVLDEVGSYGRQIGRLSDAMIVLLRHLPDRSTLPDEERKALSAFEAMAEEVAAIKERHKRKALRP